jgi:thiol-disulfide isomerase/thioredoxin
LLWGQEAEAPQLTIGSPAPALDIEHWVSDGNGKFGKVTEFEPGKVYVVEFWATWCGPCIASMPHLAETQAAYADRGVQIVSVSDEPLDTVTEFLAKPVRGAAPEADAEAAEPQTYAQLTSAYCLTTDPDESVKEAYMRAAAQNGIPTAFIVGKSGEVEWIGHPMTMDEPLAKVVEDAWDRAAFAEQFQREQQRERLRMKLMQSIATVLRDENPDPAKVKEAVAKAKEQAEGDAELLEWLGMMEMRIMSQAAMMLDLQGKHEEADAQWAAALEQLAEQPARMARAQRLQALLRVEEYGRSAATLQDILADEKAEPQLLNALAWQIYEQASEGADLPEALQAAAVAAAEKAVKGAPEDGSVVDTLAHLVHLTGDLDRALELQEQAAKLAGPSAADITEFLEQLRAEKAGQ